MSTIANETFSNLGLTGNTANAAAKKSDNLGQADFMRLMTEQLKNQDPLKPMANNDFLAQLAQFSTVQGLEDLNKKVGGFSETIGNDQMLRGAELVGHHVLVPSEKLPLFDGQTVSGVIAAPSPGEVTFEITDAKGNVVKKMTDYTDKAGEIAFQWDGLNEAGERMKAGNYSITANFVDATDKKTKVNTYVESNVESVTLGTDGMYLNLAGLGTAPLDYVLRIR